MAVKCSSNWYDAKSPEVSIIVLNFNKSDLTRECLNHIVANTTGRRYEIVIVDNGSDPAETQNLSGLDFEFKLVMLPVNRYFGEGNNIGVEASRGRYLVFLNNDAFATPNWLEPLIAVLENQLAAGGVGPKLLYPDGRLQEAGGSPKKRRRCDTAGHALRYGNGGIGRYFNCRLLFSGVLRDDPGNIRSGLRLRCCLRAGIL